jgi:hypothetical protein
MLRRERSFQQREENFTQQWCSQVFSHRCRGCGGEAVYALSEIEDFEDEQREQDARAVGQG